MSAEKPSPQPEHTEQPQFERDQRFTPEVVEALAGPATWERPEIKLPVRLESYSFSSDGHHYFKVENGEMPIPLDQLSFSRDRRRELKRAGIDLTDFLPASKAQTAEMPRTGSAETEASQTEYEQDFYSGNPKQQAQMREVAESQGWDQYERARDLADQRELEKVRGRINRTTRLGAEWDESDIRTETEKALAESKVTKHDLEQAETQRDADLEAAVAGPLDHETMMEMLQNRSRVVERLARQRSEQPSKSDYEQAAQHFRAILETGKVSGHDTGKGIDRSFSEYGHQALDRIKGTWRSPRNRGLLGIRRLATSTIRVSAEVVGIGLFSAAKLGSKQLEKRRLNQLLAE